MIKIVIFALLMVYIGYWLVGSIRRRQAGEIYAACGIGCYFAQIFWSDFWLKLHSLPIRIFGFVLFLPAAILVISSFVTLKSKGKPTDAWESTTAIIDRGIYRLTRHPMFLGTAIWSVALVFVIQSVPAVILALITIFCAYKASVKEEEVNMSKFGNDYKQYMANVPRWNIIKTLMNLKATQ